jgi:hypothetical protein
MGAVAVHIAGKLVGDQDQRQGTIGIIFPGRQAPRRGLVMQGAKALADGGIKRGIGCEPALPSGFAPESDDLGRFNGA